MRTSRVKGKGPKMRWLDGSRRAVCLKLRGRGGVGWGEVRRDTRMPIAQGLAGRQGLWLLL